MAEKYPWQKMRHEYVTGDCSYRALAEKWGVSRLRTLTDRASEENWVELRKAYRQSVAKKAAAKSATRASKALARHKLAADKVMDKLDLLLEQTAVSEDDPEGKPVVLSARELRDVAQSLKDLVAIQRDLYDLPTDGERFARMAQMEKLSMDADRSRDADAGEDSENGVIVLTEVGTDG